MTPQRCPRLAAAVGSLWSIGCSAAAWAHHAMPHPEAGEAWPWPLLWFLSACVFMVVFVATWVAFSYFERRQRAGDGERHSAPRS
jgi:heme/copper-type cytochrome/quinol oxidase subunit 2